MRARRAVVRYLESLDAPAPPEPATGTALVDAELARIEGLLADPELRAPGGSSSLFPDGSSQNPYPNSDFAMTTRWIWLVPS